MFSGAAGEVNRRDSPPTDPGKQRQSRPAPRLELGRAAQAAAQPYHCRADAPFNLRMDYRSFSEGFPPSGASSSLVGPRNDGSKMTRNRSRDVRVAACRYPTAPGNFGQIKDATQSNREWVH